MRMNLIKRLASVMLALAVAACCLALPATAFADTSGYIIDEYGLLSASEETNMESQASAMANQYGVAPYLLIVSNIGNQTQRQYAEDYYNAHSLGLDTDKSGIMFMIAVDSRDYVTITHGKGIQVFTDYEIESLEDQVVDYLHDDEFVDAGQAYLDECQSAMSFYAQNGEAIDYDNDPDSVNTKRIMALGIALILALVVMFAVRSVLKGQLKSVAAASSASAYMDGNSFELTSSNDRHINTAVSRVPKPKDDGPKGGSTISSSGFGGSSGGKF